MILNKIFTENCLTGMENIPDKIVNCCVTSPPYYGLRDYGNDEQIGMEETPEHYVQNIVEVFRKVHRVLKDDGTLWLNLGDSYAGFGKGGQSDDKRSKNWQPVYPNKGNKYGLKSKDLIGIPWMVAFALRADGWYLRSDIIWHKTNPMPESVTDRPTKSHEYIFLLSKSQTYYYDADAIAEKSLTFENRPSGVERNRTHGYESKENLHTEAYRKNINGNMSKEGVTRTTAGLKLKTKEETTKETKNKRTVWSVNTKPYLDAHFATYPELLIEPCIKAGCPENGVVLDPFMGAGTTAVVSRKLNRKYIGFELNPEYVKIANNRIYKEIGMWM